MPRASAGGDCDDDDAVRVMSPEAYVGMMDNVASSVEMGLLQSYESCSQLVTQCNKLPPCLKAARDTAKKANADAAAAKARAAAADVASIADFTYAAPEGATTTTVSLTGVIVGASDTRARVFD